MSQHPLVILPQPLAHRRVRWRWRQFACGVAVGLLVGATFALCVMVPEVWLLAVLCLFGSMTIAPLLNHNPHRIADRRAG